jgi:hypothetical protein
MGGADCPNGIGYREVSAAFKLPAGNYDIKLVAAGATDCKGDALASIQQAVVDQGKVTAFYAMGSSDTDATIKRFIESRPNQATQTAFRFIHAASGTDAVDMGAISSQTELPVALDMMAFVNVSYGNVGETPDSSAWGSADANGYVQVQLGGASMKFGVKMTSDTQALWGRAQKVENGKSYSFFLIGTPDHPEFPRELWVCSETDQSSSVYTKCGGVPYNFSATLYGTLLNGVVAGKEPPRRDMLKDAVSKMKSDFVCLWDVWADTDKQMLIDAAKSSYSNNFVAPTDWKMKPTDPTTLDGKTPDPYANPACANSSAKLDALTACWKKNACVDPATDDGALSLTKDAMSCMTLCLAESQALIGGSQDDKACFSCVTNQMNAHEKISFAKDSCTNNIDARFGYQGHQSFAMLSKFPFVSTPEYIILPDWEWRMVVIRAPVRLDNNAIVNVFCGNFTHVPTACLTRPYAGPYGEGKSCTDGAFAIQKQNQVQKLLAYLQAETSAHNRQSIVMLDSDTGPSYSQGDNKILTEKDLTTYNSLAARLAPAVPSDYIPACNFCSSNPWNPAGGDSFLLSHIFLNGIPVTTVQSNTITQTEAVYDYTPSGDAGTTKVPASPYYGVTSTIKIVPEEQ